jgi:UDP-N-acetylglucosamine 2-epimerase (non-hydrolysing)
MNNEKCLQNRTIYVFIGTKAQYIKTAPLLRLMQNAGIDYVLIDSGQHAEFSKRLRKELAIKEPDVSLVSKGNIATVFDAAIWFLRYAALAAFRPSKLRREIFRQGDGICIAHGDTPSTLLALILAKRAGIRIAHIEAGLRSFNILRPFPEELIRIICMRLSDLLFTPSDWAYENLQAMHVKGKVINVGQNTNVEALYYALESKVVQLDVKRPFCLMTMHRVETILHKKRLTFVVELAEKLAEKLTVVFILHDPTVKKLQEFGLLDRITRNPNIRSMGLVDHAVFLSYMNETEFVITDGGSIQEETFYLDVPCLVMRSETERMEGIGANVRLGDFRMDKVEQFLRDYPTMRRGSKTANENPSAKILAAILEHRCQQRVH